MTVQEYFRSLDREEFIKEYIYYCSYPKSAAKKNLIRNLLSKLDTLEVAADSSKIIFSVPVPDSESHLLDSFFIDIEDLDKDDRIEQYAYEMTPMQEILGYQISRACSYFLGKYKFACSILYEMTFFGYDLDNQEKEVIHFSKGLKEQIKEIKSDPTKLAPVDDVFEHFGFTDTRSKAEQLFDSEKFRIEGIYCQKIAEALYKLEKSYINS